MPEWSIGAVSKTVNPLRGSRVPCLSATSNKTGWAQAHLVFFVHNCQACLSDCAQSKPLSTPVTVLLLVARTPAGAQGTHAVNPCLSATSNETGWAQAHPVSLCVMQDVIIRRWNSRSYRLSLPRCSHISLAGCRCNRVLLRPLHRGCHIQISQIQSRWCRPW